jgi:hypothetical protein
MGDVRAGLDIIKAFFLYRRRHAHAAPTIPANLELWMVAAQVSCQGFYRLRGGVATHEAQAGDLAGIGGNEAVECRAGQRCANILRQITAVTARAVQGQLERFTESVTSSGIS